MRTALLTLSLLGLTLAYNVLPRRGPDSSASRWQTLSMDYLNASYEDPGLYWLIDLTGASWAQVQFGLFAVALGLLSLRAIPLSVALGANLAFFVAFATGVLYWSWDVYWAPALSVLMTLAFLLNAGSSKQVPTFCAIVFGAFVGLLGLVRQDAGLIAQASALVFLLWCGVDWTRRVRDAREYKPDNARHSIESPWVKPSPQPESIPATTTLNKQFRYSTKTGKRLIVLALCFLAATFIPKAVFRAHVALSGVEVRGNLEHGPWHNLYLGMGFNANAHPETANPYGIVWDDTVGAEHAARAGAVFGSPEYMPTMRALFFRIVLHDPVFYLKSVMSRLMYELYLIGGLAYSVVGWLAALLIVWPAVFFTKHRLLYLIVCGVSILPPVLTYPSPQYSLGVAMGLIACPLFALGSMYVDGIEDSRRYLRALGVRGRGA